MRPALLIRGQPVHAMTDQNAMHGWASNRHAVEALEVASVTARGSTPNSGRPSTRTTTLTAAHNCRNESHQVCCKSELDAEWKAP
jgi:hypothetical protein